MRIAATLLSMAVVLTLASSGLAAGYGGAGGCGEDVACGKVDACHGCGVAATCKKRCNVVCDVKTVKRVVWVVECEEFCVPDPCRKLDLNIDRCGRGTGAKAGCGSCGDCGEKDPCKALTDRKYTPPKCGKVRTRKILVKKEITCEIPIYKCVVVDSCGSCGDGEIISDEGSGGIPAPVPTEAAPLPPPPEQSTRVAPKSKVIGTSYLEALKFD